MGRLFALWSIPRAVSTAFERMVIERGDLQVFDEPWSRAYYFGPDRRSDRHPLCFPESSYAAVTAAVLAAADDRDVFVKDMAYQAAPGLDDEQLGQIEHTFLTRAPAASIASLRRGWPDATWEEAGFAAQHALFERVSRLAGRVPAVIDSDALLADPAGVVARWCDRVGLPPRPDALSWTPGMRPEWPLWQDWYRATCESSGFASPSGRGTGPVDDPWVVRARPLHEAMVVHAL